MQTEKPWITGAALSVVVAVVYVLCGVVILFFPEGTLTLLNQWTHGIDLSLIKRAASPSIPLSAWLTGFLTSVVASFLTGTLFGWIRNVLSQLAGPAHQK